MGRRLSWYHPNLRKHQLSPLAPLTQKYAPVFQGSSGVAPALRIKAHTKRLLSEIRIKTVSPVVAILLYYTSVQWKCQLFSENNPDFSSPVILSAIILNTGAAVSLP